MINEFERKLRLSWKFRRMEKGIKLKELAEYIDCHISHINKYENSKGNMSSDKVRLYEKYITNK